MQITALLDYARDNALQIVVVAPERPDFMHAQDWFVEWAC